MQEGDMSQAEAEEEDYSKGGGIHKDGYGVEVLGYEHSQRTDTESVVELPKDIRYKLRLYNANDYMCMVKTEVDGVDIGTFLMYGYTVIDLERPADRPLGFIFCPPDPVVTASNPDLRSRGKSVAKTQRKKSPVKNRTCVTCTFMPEMGSKTIQFDTKAHQMEITQRTEMPNDCTVYELFNELTVDFGDWVKELTCALLHWTTAEYDSSVDDVMTADMHVALRDHLVIGLDQPFTYNRGNERNKLVAQQSIWSFSTHLGPNCKRKEAPLRKMSLLNIKKLLVIVDDGETHTDITLDLEKVPTFETIFNALNDVISTADVTDATKTKKVWYFTAQSERYLCSSDWITGQTFLYQLLHKNEILEAGQCLQIKASTSKPKQCHPYYIRILNGGVHELEACPEHTVRDCRYQLGLRGGPWGEDPRWLYGGTLMDSGRTLDHYGVRRRDTMDIVLRLKDQCQIRPLEKREPIAVDDSDKPIDTACLIRKEPPRNANQVKQREGAVRKPHRGGTTLRGKVNQQFVEVDPVEVDDRFFATLLVSLLPEDDIVLESEDEEEKSSKACIMM